MGSRLLPPGVRPQGQPRPRTTPTPLSWMRSLGGWEWRAWWSSGGGVVQVAIPGSRGTAGPGGGRGSSRCGPQSAASGSGSRRSSSPAGRSSTWTGSSPPLQGHGQVRAGQAPRLPPPSHPGSCATHPGAAGTHLGAGPGRALSGRSSTWRCRWHWLRQLPGPEAPRSTAGRGPPPAGSGWIPETGPARPAVGPWR